MLLCSQTNILHEFGRSKCTLCIDVHLCNVVVNMQSSCDLSAIWYGAVGGTDGLCTEVFHVSVPRGCVLGSRAIVDSMLALVALYIWALLG